MNEEQAFAAIRNAIRLENLGADVARKITPELARIFAEVRRIVRTMPEGSVERTLYWRQQQLRLATIFQGVDEQFYQELIGTLRLETVEQVEWARSYLAKADDLVTPPPSAGVSVLSTAGYEATLGPAGQITRTQLLALADDTKVLGKRLETLFGDGVFSKTQVKRIDRVVKQGFLLGQTNEEIARGLAAASGGALRDTRAIARTAVMDMSQRAHNRFWDANSDVVKGWQFDSTFDYRVCMVCMEYSGRIVEKRSSLPRVPLHPNCRCRILPLTATEMRLREAEGPGTMSVVEITKNRSDATGRVYKTPVRVKGEKVTRFARKIKVPEGQRPSMGLFLARANRETRVNVLGKARAEWFEANALKQGTRRMSPDDALREAIKKSFKRSE